MGDVQGRVLEQDLSGGGDAEIGNVNVQRILPLGILFVDGRLGTGKLGSFSAILGGNLFVFGSSFGCLPFLDQSFSFLVAEFLSVLAVHQLRIRRIIFLRNESKPRNSIFLFQYLVGKGKKEMEKYFGEYLDH